MLDGFMLVTIGGLILLDVLPHCYLQAGPIVVALALLGLFGPTLIERLRHRLAVTIHRTALVLGMLGLLLHSFIDGAGLVGSPTLSLALILHRVPVGLAVWTLLRRNFGTKTAVVGLVLLNASTVAGFYTANLALEHLGGGWISGFTALVGGSLLHVVVHLSPGGGKVRNAEWFETLGAGLGVLLLAFALGGHQHTLGHSTAPGPAQTASSTSGSHEPPHDAHHGHDHSAHDSSGAHSDDWLSAFGDRFLNLASESALALLFAYLVAALIFGFLSSGSLSWLSASGGRVSQSTRGVLFGLPLPICSCGVVPIYASLVRRGVPLGAAVAFLIATPELGIDAAFLSWRLTGFEFTLVRLLAAAAVAFTASILLANAAPPQPDQVNSESDDAPPKTTRLRMSIQGLSEIVDHTAPWIIFGIALAALAEPLIQPETFSEWAPWVQVPLFAVIGMPIYVCASGATPLAAVLLTQGVAPGAVLAFLLTGPATNATTFGILRQLHGGRFALKFALTIATLATLAGGISNFALEGVTFELPSRSHQHVSSVIPLALVAILFLFSLLRLGPRGFVRQILTQTSGARSGPCSEEECGGCSH